MSTISKHGSDFILITVRFRNIVNVNKISTLINIIEREELGYKNIERDKKIFSHDSAIIEREIDESLYEKV